MFTDQTVAFIGSGTIAEAMIRGLLEGGLVAPERIVAAGPRAARGDELAARHGVIVTTDNAAAAEAGQIVVLSVKPQVLATVLPEVRGHLRRSDLLLSIVAGAPIRRLADGAAHAAVVRAMPNTPAQIGEGITVWTATSEVPEAGRARAQAILAALGEEILVVAERLVRRTLRGSVDFAESSGLHVAELRNQVTSPGGTTAEALYHLEKGGLRTVISRAIWAAYERSVALGRDGD